MASKRSMGMRTRLALVFTLIVTTIVIGWVAMLKTKDDLFSNRKIQLEIVSALEALNDMKQAFAEANLLGMDIGVDYFEDPSRQVVRAEEFEELSRDIKSRLVNDKAKLEGLTSKARVDEIETQVENLLVSIEDMMRVINSGADLSLQIDEFDRRIDGARTIGTQYIDDELVLLEKTFQESTQQTEELTERLNFLTGLVFGICLVAVGLWATPIVFSIARSVQNSQKELASLANRVDAASGELEDSSQTLAEASTEAASAIQESVSSMTEMSAMLAETSRNATDTAQLSKDVLEQARDGVGVMREMASSMDAISESSARLKEIVRIIENIASKTNVINDVVFKTQLLAVNASIEAARAGHHGKGFAVVANEVASLAALSGKASSEIRELLSSSSAHVSDIIDGTSRAIKSGEETCSRSADAFEKISSSVSVISEKVDQISEASREQESGIAQTYTALTQMNQATTETNSLAQRNAHLGKTIANYAVELRNLDRTMRILTQGSASEKLDKFTRVSDSSFEDKPSVQEHLDEGEDNDAWSSSDKRRSA